MKQLDCYIEELEQATEIAQREADQWYSAATELPVEQREFYARRWNFSRGKRQGLDLALELLDKGSRMSEPKASTHAHDYWWGLYEDGDLIDVACWHNRYQPSVSDFDYPLSSESDYLVMEVQIEPI